MSLQAMRLVVETLSDDERDRGSIIQTLNLVDANGVPVPPQWDVSSLPIHRDCGCIRER
ncbi:MAG: hypothetical protein IH898_00975 [Planctomycetes bacterium]|nr:hypothetical protein [Planctomycetota bacterium]